MAMMCVISVDLQMEEEQKQKYFVREPEMKQEEQDEVNVANMAIFAARSRTPTFSCLPEQAAKMIPKRLKIKRNYRRRNPPNWLNCEFCGKSFIKRLYVRLHKHRKHPELIGDNEVACKFCPRYYTIPAMIHHMRGKHPEKANTILKKKMKKVGRTKKTIPLQCKVCKKCFTQHKSLTYHMQKKKACTSEMAIENDSNLFQCELCKKDFTSQQCLKIHMITHMSKKPHNCEYCGRGFAQRANFVRHVCIAHPAQKIEN